jgi:hypothetical protein
MKTNQLPCPTRCPISPMLFIVYRNAILRRWTDNTRKHYTKNNNTLDTLMYAHDQIIFTNNGDELLYWVHHLKFIASEFYTEISVTKSKPMSCRGKTLVRNKICVGNSTLEQVNSFNTWATPCLTQNREIWR